MKDRTFDDILGDFSLSEAENAHSLKDGAPVTIWLPADAKARYDRLQTLTKKKFSKKAREALLVLIEAAESRAS